MSSRGLPGFLRRTLRVDYSFDDDEEEVDDHAEQDVQIQELDNNDQEVDAPDHSAQQEKVNEQQSNAQAYNESTESASAVANNGESTVDTAAAAASQTTTRSTPNGGETERGNETEPQRNQSITSENSVTVPPRYAATEGSLHLELPGPAEAPQRSYRDIQFDKVMSADVINMAELRKLAWNGIPSRHRAAAWKILLGYLPTNQSRRAASLARKRAEYKEAVKQHYDIDDDTRTAQEQETLRQVLVDVPRTAPEVALFRNERIRRILARLLYVWAMRHPASSYVQGINDLATPLIVVYLADYYEGEDVLDGHVMNHLSEERLDELEADVYWCLTNLLSGIQDHYTADQPGVQRMVMRLEELVKRIDADLCLHLEEMCVQFLQFSFRWMNCLLLREFELRCVVRLWDTYISEKDGFEGFHVYVCAAFLCQFSPQLQAMSFDELLGFMQKIPTQEWTDTEIEMLLSQAFVLSTLFGGSDAHLTSGNVR